jgi:SAM-dependent methyltransferase
MAIILVVADHAKRTADTAAAFFLPFIKPGMRLLDVGCGPGSITVGLAQRVEPGETIGIDPSPSVIETAKLLANAKAAKHLSFEVGNVYESGFAGETFDGVFAHQVLQHLRDPVDALRQMMFLLKSGGVLGVRDVDWGSTTFYPENEGIRRFLTLYYELARRNGGEATPDGSCGGGCARQAFPRHAFQPRRCPIRTRLPPESGAILMPSAPTFQSCRQGRGARYRDALELEDIAAAWRARAATRTLSSAFAYRGGGVEKIAEGVKPRIRTTEPGHRWSSHHETSAPAIYSARGDRHLASGHGDHRASAGLSGKVGTHVVNRPEADGLRARLIGEYVSRDWANS